MDGKKKVIFIDVDDNQRYEHLILDDSQFRFLKFLVDNDYFSNGYRYEVEENDIEWKEI